MNQPEGRFDNKTGLWLLLNPWKAMLSDGRTLVVDAGFLSDGASIPWILQPVVGPRFSATTFPAAFGHDSLYASELLPREQCDEQFRLWLIECGCWRMTARLYWMGVRLGGGAVWAKHKKDEVDQARHFYVRILD